MLKREERAGILKLHRSGLTAPQIAAIVRRSPSTIYRLLEFSDSKLDQPKKRKSGILSSFEKYLDQQIQRGITNSYKLFKEIRSFGYKGSYGTVYRYLKTCPCDHGYFEPPNFFNTKPGEQAQVDWGSFGKIEIHGKLERLYCFVYVLGYSRMLYIEFTIKQNLQTLLECHKHAFEKVGIPKEILYDNMKTVVLRRERLPDGKQIPHYNPAFMHFADHYGFKIRSCRPYRARTKGKVESGVKYVRNNFMKGVKIKTGPSSLKELNAKAQVWLNEVANVREHGTTREIPINLWKKERQCLNFHDDFLPYETSPFVVRNSTQYGVIHYKANFYSVPMRFSRRKLFVKEVNSNGVVSIDIYHESKRIATHPLHTGRGEWITDEDHLVGEKLGRSSKKGSRNEKQKNKLPEVVSVRPLSYYDRLLRLNDG